MISKLYKIIHLHNEKNKHLKYYSINQKSKKLRKYYNYDS